MYNFNFILLSFLWGEGVDEVRMLVVPWENLNVSRPPAVFIRSPHTTPWLRVSIPDGVFMLFEDVRESKPGC